MYCTNFGFDYQDSRGLFLSLIHSKAGLSLVGGGKFEVHDLRRIVDHFKMAYEDLKQSSEGPQMFHCPLVCSQQEPWKVFLIKYTYFPSSFFSSSATGFKENFSFLCPFGRPRWLIRTTDFAPLSRPYLIVGRAPTIRWLFVISLPFKGTLKSTLQERMQGF